MLMMLFIMNLPDSVIDTIPVFLARKFFQVSFGIPTAFIDISAEPILDTTATTDHDYSPDSTSEEFVSAEQHILGSLGSFRAKLYYRMDYQPKTHIEIIRHQTRVFLHGFVPSFTMLRSLASVSYSWLRAIYKEISDELFVVLNDLERASQEWELPYRVLCSTQEEYIARFTGRVVRNLFIGRVNVPVIRQRLS